MLIDHNCPISARDVAFGGTGYNCLCIINRFAANVEHRKFIKYITSKTTTIKKVYYNIYDGLKIIWDNSIHCWSQKEWQWLLLCWPHCVWCYFVESNGSVPLTLYCLHRWRWRRACNSSTHCCWWHRKCRVSFFSKEIAYRDSDKKLWWTSCCCVGCFLSRQGQDCQSFPQAFGSWKLWTCSSINNHTGFFKEASKGRTWISHT